MGLRRAAASVFVCALVFGCSDGEHPAAESGAVGLAASEVESTDSTAAPATHPVCEPLSGRDCKQFYSSRSEPGVQHCRYLTQYCRADGRGWYTCGDTESHDADLAAAGGGTTD